VDIPIHRICLDYIFDSVVTLSPSTSFPSSLGFLWRDFIFAVPHTRVYDALASIMDYIWVPPTSNPLEIPVQHDRVWFVDIIGHTACAGVEG
jgi:hypothetical protein